MADRRKGLTISVEFLLPRLTEVLSMVVNIFLALLFTQKEILIALIAKLSRAPDRVTLPVKARQLVLPSEMYMVYNCVIRRVQSNSFGPQKSVNLH